MNNIHGSCYTVVNLHLDVDNVRKAFKSFHFAEWNRDVSLSDFRLRSKVTHVWLRVIGVEATAGRSDFHSARRNYSVINSQVQLNRFLKQSFSARLNYSLQWNIFSRGRRRGPAEITNTQFIVVLKLRLFFLLRICVPECFRQLEN